MAARRNGKQKGRYVDGPFVPLTHAVRCSPAWRALSLAARLLYLELRAKLSNDPQVNNGRVFLSTRDAAGALGVCQRTAMNGFRELQAKGFVKVTQLGTLGSEGRGKATLYRLTECGTMEHYEGTKDYLSWKAGGDLPVQKGKAPTRGWRAVSVSGKDEAA